MRSSLAVYDASAFVYAGINGIKYGSRTHYGYPVGGIHYLMKHLATDLKIGTDVAIAFDSKLNYQNIMKNYKAGRKTNYAVFSQLDFLYEYLSKCGLACYKKPHCEADSLIYNIINQCKDNYLKAEIHSVDYDLLHNIDEGKVKFCAITSQVNSVKYSNFEYSIVRGERILFNTISAYKVFMGDSSDGITPFKSARGITGGTLYNKFVDLIQSLGYTLKASQTRSRKLLENYINKLGNVLFDVDRQELKKRMDIIFPKELEGDFTNVSSEKSINKEALVEFLSLVNDRDTLRLMKRYVSPVTEDMLDVLRRKARELETGEFAVDKKITVNPISANTMMLNLKEF